MNNFFISHYSGDKEIAAIIAVLLRRISLGQLNTWFSSDDGNNGLLPGHKWFEEIIQQLKKSKAVVVLLTPDSLNRQWLYFESGIGEALEDCEIIPVVIGLKGFNEIPFPLALYQSYNLSDYESLRKFVLKLLGKYNVVFDEEMAQPVLSKAVKEITNQLAISQKKSENISNQDLEENVLFDKLKGHFDKRFLNLIEIIENNSNRENVNIDVEISTVEIELDFPNNRKGFLEIRRNDTVQDAYDRIYSMLSDEVEAFTYMTDWMLVEKNTNVKLVLREVARFIPASTLFNSNLEWVAIKLKKPYAPYETNEGIDNWYYKKS